MIYFSTNVWSSWGEEAIRENTMNTPEFFSNKFKEDEKDDENFSKC